MKLFMMFALIAFLIVVVTASPIPSEEVEKELENVEKQQHEPREQNYEPENIKGIAKIAEELEKNDQQKTDIASITGDTQGENSERSKRTIFLNFGLPVFYGIPTTYIVT